MKITLLDKIVREKQIDVIHIPKKDNVRVKSDDYQLIKDHLVKGDWGITRDYNTGDTILIIEGSLDTELNVEIGDFKIEGAQPVDDSKIYSVVIQHKHSESMSGKDIRFSDIVPFAQACVQSYKNNHPELVIKNSDFLIILVDWETKNIKTQQILD